ncbi:MAG: ATP-binding protein [Clostridiales bacterium]|nr:ATP-binding protein [Clostridiales bacterium]
MGIYLNPRNEAFRQILNGIYVDKTGLIEYINNTISAPFNLTCFSRPRRFGKSFAAMMLSAYYDKGCNSEELFKNLKISESPSYKTHMNKYNVIYLDITGFISRAKSRGSNIVVEIQSSIINELKRSFPNCVKASEVYLPDAISDIFNETNEKFFIIIDEWDALFREAKDNRQLQLEYIQLLRGLFKSGPAMRAAIAGAYMTGILPIKKYGTQSALTDFKEYTMVDPLALSEYVGFTEQEVQTLCQNYNIDFNEMKKWYDGYSFADIKSVYNPNSVINAVTFKRFKSYWTSSETYESLRDYISMNFDGLKDAIIAMLGGEKIKVKTERFQNDMTSFKSKDDVLTLLIHLGYLAFDGDTNKVYIPNSEIAGAFQEAVEGEAWKEIEKALSESEDLLMATIQGDTAAVETALEEIHDSNFSVLKYNDENSLSCAVTLAYYTARNYYEIIRELPTGKGFADIAFIPRKNTDKPALLVELKYNKSADTAIKQIKENRYSGKLKDYFGNLLLVGINYDKDAKGESRKKHTCIIEKA